MTINGGTLKNLATNQIDDASIVTVNSGTWNLNGNSEAVAGLAGSGGTITSSTGTPILTVNGTGNNSFSGVISNSGGTLSLAMSGTGTQTLRANNTFSGGLTINTGGTVLAQNFNNATGTGTITVKGTLQMAGNITPSGPLALNANCTLESVSGNNTVTWPNPSVAVLIQSDSGSNLTINTGNGGLNAAEVLTFKGQGNINLSNTGEQAFGTDSFNGDMTGNGVVNMAGNYNIPATTINSGTMQFSTGSSNSGTANSVKAITDNGTLVFNMSGAAGQTGIISGNGTVIQSGTGTLTLNQANTYSGGTTVNAGTLQAGNASAFGATTGLLTVNGGTVDLHGFSVTVAGVSGRGGVIGDGSTTTASTLTLATSSPQNYSGVIRNTVGTGNKTLAVVVSGTSTQTLSGNNTYSGGTTINAGTLLARTRAVRPPARAT